MSSFIIQIMKMFTSYAQKVYFNHLKKNNGFIFVYLVICYIITNFALFVKFSFNPLVTRKAFSDRFRSNFQEIFKANHQEFHFLNFF